MKVVSIKENKEYLSLMIEYFQRIWASDDSKMVYEDCITHALDYQDTLSNWYLLMDNETIIGCVGLISNDFVSRMDLTPYLCALYIEESYRGHNYASLLIEKVKEDCLKLGYDNLYLCTDHIGYYEHFGFEYLCTGYHPWGDSSRIYKCVVNESKKELVNNVKTLIDKSLPIYSNLANLSKLLKDSFANVSWAGFYLAGEDETLYLHAYQGPLACGKIPYGKGVCGTCAITFKPQLIPNVHECNNHIACSSLTNSEVVVPIIYDSIFYGVIDLDSNVLNNFTEEDVEILLEVANLIGELFDECD